MNIDIVYFSESEPVAIKENSELIKTILASEDFDAQQLLETVEKRESIILDFLKNDQDIDKSLLQDLVRTNKDLTEVVNLLKSDQQKVLVKFLRNRKAVKKYQ